MMTAPGDSFRARPKFEATADSLCQLLPWLALAFSGVILEILPNADEINDPLLLSIILLKETGKCCFAACRRSPHIDNIFAVNKLSE
jgi:hypothetical protein